MKTITVAGKLGRDAETRQVGQDSVTSFSVAVDSREKKNGAYEKVTLWFDASLWGKRGEALRQYLVKGTSVCVVGDFSTRSYQAKDGSTKHALEVRVAELTLMGSKGEARERRPNDDDRANSRSESRSNAAPVEDPWADDGSVPF